MQKKTSLMYVIRKQARTDTPGYRECQWVPLCKYISAGCQVPHEQMMKKKIKKVNYFSYFLYVLTSKLLHRKSTIFAPNILLKNNL